MYITPSSVTAGVTHTGVAFVATWGGLCTHHVALVIQCNETKTSFLK